MYDLKEIKVIHLEPTRKCQAKCPMCPRRIRGGKLNPNVDFSPEISLEDFKKWFQPDFVSQLNRLYMCGNLGDPIMATDSLEIFEYLRENNSKIKLNMMTNGSARNQNWWEKLAKIKVRVIFALDGMEDTHALHRLNTNWSQIIKNAQYFINAGGRAEWAMLVFKHNEHQVEECRSLAKKMGFNIFHQKHSSRFQTEEFAVLNEEGEVTHILNPTTQSINLREKINTIDAMFPISCIAAKNKSLFVSADGTIVPCCWIGLDAKSANDPELIEYSTRIGKPLSLHDYSLSEIFQSGFARKVENTWCNSALRVCSRKCGKVVTSGSQTVEKSKLK